MLKTLSIDAGNERGALAALGTMTAGLYLLGLAMWLADWHPLTARAAPPAAGERAATRIAAVPLPPVKPAAPAPSGKRALFGGGTDAKGLGLYPTVTLVSDIGGLIEKLTGLNYDLRQVRLGNGNVPRTFLTSLPRDLPTIRSAKVRKTAFIKSILPLILRANRAILADRKRLLETAARFRAGAQVDVTDQAWLYELARSYGIQEVELDELERRVDIVPPSLALAQAAEESGWGTSRFAIEGNAVYGQWTWRQGSGLVPRRRDQGKRHEVKIFESLQSSVDAYMRNLNTHWAYEAFRARRAALRAEGRPLSGEELVETMAGYSERGAAYIETLRTIMRYNRLGEFDSARLHDPIPAGTML